MIPQDPRACPTATDLLDHVEGRLAPPEANRIRAHLDRCPDCLAGVERLQASVATPPASTAVPPSIRAVSTEEGAEFRRLRQTRPPAAPRFGDLWTTRLPLAGQDMLEGEVVQPRIVVPIDGLDDAEGAGRTLLTAPISLDVAFRSSHDLMVRAHESPLGYRFMVEAWNEVPIPAAQMGQFLGTLPQPLRRYLGLVYQAAQGEDVDLTEVADRIGPAILHDADPRVAFQEREIEAVAYLRRPAVAAALTPVAAPEAVVQLSGSAVKAARQQAKLDIRQVADALIARGHDVKVPWVLGLEQGGVTEAAGRVAQALAEVLHVSLQDLLARGRARVQNGLTAFLASRRCQQIIEAWARPRGEDPEEVKAWAAERLSAAPRRSQGEPDEAYWEQMLITLLETRR